MEEGNILTAGVDKLNEIKEDLLELRGYQENFASLTAEEEKNEKSIQSLEKAAADEVQTTIKKRRSEIEGAYDKQLDKIKSQIRKIKNLLKGIPMLILRSVSDK